MPIAPEYLISFKNILFDYRTIDSGRVRGSAIGSRRQNRRFDLLIETANGFSPSILILRVVFVA